MDSLLHRSDVSVEIMLNKALKDAITDQMKAEYLESLRT